MKTKDAKRVKEGEGRWARVLPRGRGYYVHVLSRVVDRRYVLGEVEKAYFRGLMRRLGAFSGIRIVTYALLDNHFHLLLEVRPREELSEEAFMGRLEALYEGAQLAEIRERLERFRGYAGEGAYLEERGKYEERMGDLGQFMKTLKQQFTRWYNRRHGRSGTLWEARYKSVVVEGAREPLLTMAGYIDLNAVRAGLVEDPKDYRWCGYGEAVAGVREAREGLSRIAEESGRSTQWRMVQRMYRLALYGAGGRGPGGGEGERPARVIRREEVLRVWKEKGALSRRELLQCRVRYLSEGVALGSRLFVEELFAECRDRFGERRRSGGRRLRGTGFGALYSFRDFQKQVVS